MGNLSRENKVNEQLKLVKDVRDTKAKTAKDLEDMIKQEILDLREEEKRVIYPKRELLRQRLDAIKVMNDGKLGSLQEVRMDIEKHASDVGVRHTQLLQRFNGIQKRIEGEVPKSAGES